MAFKSTLCNIQIGVPHYQSTNKTKRFDRRCHSWRGEAHRSLIFVPCFQKPLPQGIMSPALPCRASTMSGLPSCLTHSPLSSCFPKRRALASGHRPATSELDLSITQGMLSFAIPLQISASVWSQGGAIGSSNQMLLLWTASLQQSTWRA